MIDLALPREQAALLSVGMERHCPAGELEKGYGLYRAGGITHAWKDQFNIVHAIVRTDDGDIKLQLDLDFFLASECACGGAKICSHMAAVFFLLFSRHADPAAWLDDLLREGGRRSDDRDRAFARQEISPPSAEEDLLQPARWGHLIDREMDRLVRKLGNRRRIDIFYLNACKKLFSFAESLAEGDKARFRLFAALRIMRHAGERLDGWMEDGYKDPSSVRMVQDLGQLFLEQVRHAASLIGSVEADGEAAGVLLAQVRDTLPPPGRIAMDWIGIHRLLWTELFGDGELRRSETDRLKKLAAEAEDDDTRRDIRLCIAHLLWLEGNDEGAMAELSLLSVPAPERIAVYWDTLRKAGSWTRFAAWFSFAIPRLSRADGDTFRRALEALEDYYDKTGDERYFRQALIGLLPRSADAYARFLADGERYGEWVYFHLLNGTEPDRLERSHRLRAESRAPRLMLPLYHQAIERLIAAKSRTAYREIAKLAKRLKSLYQSLGEEDRFHIYLDQLQERNGRQHALLEELQKGNLLA